MSRNSGLSVSSLSLKYGTVSIFVGFILHVVGFSIARWATLTVSRPNIWFDVQKSYHAGLWKHCVCIELLIVDQCACFSRGGDKEWLMVVKAMETLGLIGLIISGIISSILVCYKQTHKLKKLNIYLIISSGVTMFIGLAIFRVEMTNFLEDMFDIINKFDSQQAHGELSISFIMCVTANVWIFIVCLPLFVIDLHTPIPETREINQQIEEWPVHFTNQGQVATQSNQAQVMEGMVDQRPTMIDGPTYTQNILPPAYTPHTSGSSFMADIQQEADKLPSKK